MPFRHTFSSSKHQFKVTTFAMRREVGERSLTSWPSMDSSVVSLWWREPGDDIISSSSRYTGSLSVTFSMCFLSEVMDFLMSSSTINLMGGM